MYRNFILPLLPTEVESVPNNSYISIFLAMFAVFRQLSKYSLLLIHLHKLYFEIHLVDDYQNATNLNEYALK